MKRFLCHGLIISALAGLAGFAGCQAGPSGPTPTAGVAALGGTNAIIKDIGHNPRPGTPGGSARNYCRHRFDCYHLFSVKDDGQPFVPPSWATYGVATLLLGPTNNAVPLVNTNWDLFWRVSALNRDCASNSTRHSFQKAWRIRAWRRHQFTVYYLGTNCPPTNTLAGLQIDWFSYPVPLVQDTP